jgi:hypothetical protein
MGWIPQHSHIKIDLLFSPPKPGFAYTQKLGLVALSGLEAGMRVGPDIILRGTALYATGASSNGSEKSEKERENSRKHNQSSDVSQSFNTPATHQSTAYPRTHASPPRHHHAHHSHHTTHPHYSSDSEETQQFDQYIQEITKSLPHAHSTHHERAVEAHHHAHAEKSAESHHHAHAASSASSSKSSLRGLYVKESKLKFSATPLNVAVKEKVSSSLFSSLLSLLLPTLTPSLPTPSLTLRGFVFVMGRKKI